MQLQPSDLLCDTAGCLFLVLTAKYSYYWDFYLFLLHLHLLIVSVGIVQDLSRDDKMDPMQQQILSFISYIGCGISAIFLAVTLLTHLSFE